MNKKILASWLILLAVSLTGFIVYPFLPDLMASHWGLSGEVNGYMSKMTSVILLPLLMLGLLVLFLVIPRIDPLKNNILKFRKYYDDFILIMISFLAYVFGLIIVWNLGYKFDLFRFMIPALAGLFYYLGIILPQTRPNWFLGIRTPWTLSNARVWYKTHKKAGRLFKFVAILSLGGLIWPTKSFYFIFWPIIGVSIYLLFYSYWIFNKEKDS